MNKLWHNPRCSKSRQAHQLLIDNGVDFRIRLYLKDPPTVAELAHAVKLLGDDALAIIRQNQSEFAQIDTTDQSALIAAMNKAPILIERPIFFSGGRAIIGRPPELVLTIL